MEELIEGKEGFYEFDSKSRFIIKHPRRIITFPISFGIERVKDILNNEINFLKNRGYSSLPNL